MARPARLVIDIITNARDVGRGVDEASGRLGRLGKVGKAAGAAVAAGAAAAGVAAVALVGSSVKAASSLEQNFGALESVYGENAAAVKKWANQAATSVGLSASSYAELSAQVGSQLQSMGYATRESAQETDRLVKIGADLAATFGGETSDAVAAVGSLLRGERDPIERYGVAIKQADVNAKLAAMGLSGLTGEAGKQAQAQATLALLTEQTTNAQGAFGREANTLAGQQQRLTAKWENAKAQLGRGLLPILTRLASFVSDRVLPAAQRLAGIVGDKLRPAFDAVKRAVADNRPELEQLARIGAQVAKVVGGVLLSGLQGTFRAIGAGVRVVGSLVRGFRDAYDAARRLAKAVKDSPVGKALDAVGLFSAGGLVTGRPALTGGTSYGQQLGGLATAALSSGGYRVAAGGAFGGGQLTVVDRRSFPTQVTVNGALDAPAVARQLRRILDDQAVRMGRATAYGAGRA